MLEGTANGDGELEGTEDEFSALEIYFENVSYSLDWDEKREVQLILSTK